MAETYSLTPEQVERIDRMNRDELRAEMIRTGKELEFRVGGVYRLEENTGTLIDMYDYASDRLSEC